ncbi:MAG TPA: prefoldin subunit beta [Candidatus Thermoplasmatota archaeon]|nr:prefoldin subunit beta [Candidatus Thermoplasmatota archaeon]
MAADLPPQLQNQLQQLQQLQSQAQVVVQQRQQMEVSARDLDRTLEELEKAAPDAVIYRSIGGLLIRAKDRDTLLADLREQKETTDVRLQTVKRQEERLRERMTSLQKELQAALGGA